MWLKELMKQEVEPSSTASTLSSTSQRDRVKRLILNMRWGSLRRLPRGRASTTLPSGATTSLKSPLTSRAASESSWPTASLALEKPSRCRSSLLDWAEDLENQDVGLLTVLSFRELNLVKDQQHSLLTLLRVFHPALQKLTAETLAVCKPLFILDGLDESRLPLDFNHRKLVSDVTQRSSVNVLLTNLIQGNLLPSALVWITSRPAAANQIPPTCVDRVTEVRGFTDAQKEEYFRRRFSDEELCSRIISHIKTSRSLHIMCEIPVFCWISATVLEHMLTTDQRGELPKTLTDLYSHFLLVQTKRKNNKYGEGHETTPQQLTEADRDVLLKLGRLAFKHLVEGNIMFYQEDLERCGLNVTEASVYSGVCTEIFRRECVIFKKSVYCFVHLSVQEFLAAVYMFHRYTKMNTEELNNFLRTYEDTDSTFSLCDLLKKTMKKSLTSTNGHLDLFVRFLHGLSLESNQRVLGGLLGQTENNPTIIQRVINNLKEMQSEDISPDRSINIFHCLTEMNDHSVHQQMQQFLMSENRSEEKLSEIHCLSSGLHAADLRGGSGWVGPGEIQHIRPGSTETDPSCEELQEGSVSPDMINNMFRVCVCVCVCVYHWLFL